MAAIYNYLRHGVHTREAPYRRLRNLKRAAARYRMDGEMMFYVDKKGRRIRACVTQEERNAALKTAHDKPVAGHWGAQKTWKLLKSAALWPGHAEDCFRYALSCNTCQLRSSVDLKAPAPTQTIPYPQKPFRLVAVDMKKMPKSPCGKLWLAVAVCHSTKFVEAAALPDKKAETLAVFYPPTSTRGADSCDTN